MTLPGAEIPSASLSRSASKRTNSNFKPFLGRNWPKTINAKLNQLKNWYNKICSVFQNSHSLITHPFSTSIFIPLGNTNFFETDLTWKLILQRVKWHRFRWWCLELNQIIFPDVVGELRSYFFPLFELHHFHNSYHRRTYVFWIDWLTLNKILHIDGRIIFNIRWFRFFWNLENRR